MLITIYFEKIQINVETIYSEFRKFGNIQKIIIFRKKNYQIFVELASTEEALQFKNQLQNQNFDHLFNLKIQFTQKKELVVNNNTMTEFDFTKSDSETYSDFRTGSFSDIPNNAFSETHKNLFFQGHPSTSMMTPESLNKLMYIPELEENSHARFMTPKGSNIGIHPKDNCPSSARLDLKLGNSRNFYPNAGNDKLNENIYSMGVFRNMMDFSGFSNPRMSNQRENKDVMNTYGGTNLFGSDRNSMNENQMTKIKNFNENRNDGNSKKSLSLKEKYRLKVLANKRKKKEKKNKDESKDTVAPLSTESKTTLEKPSQESKNYHQKTEKKEKEANFLNKKQKEEKTTAKKKTVIINPNIVVNNFSFKCEPKNLNHENNPLFHNKIAKDLETTKPQTKIPKKDSNFSLTNLKEHLSQESIEDGKLNIFRVFDHENSSEKNSLMSNSRHNIEEKEMNKYFKIKENSEDSCSKDSFKEFNFKMSSEDNNSEIETDIMQTQQGGFRFSREYLEDSLSDVGLREFSEMVPNFEEQREKPLQDPLDGTLKHSNSRNIYPEADSGISQPISMNNLLTFHSNCIFFLI